MFSGGELRIDPYQIDSNKDGTITKDELDKAIKDGDEPVKPKELTEDKLIRNERDGSLVTYKALSDTLNTGKKIRGGTGAGSKLNEAIAETNKRQAQQKITEILNELEELKRAKVESRDAKLFDGTTVKKEGLENAIAERIQRLQLLQTRIQQANQTLKKDRNDGVPEKLSSELGVEKSGKNGNGAAGEFKVPGPKASFAPPASHGGGQSAPGSGGSDFGGFPASFAPPFSTGAYAASLYADSMVSDGLGNLFKSQREGQRLMMLFFYYARMAASGDLGAMYELIKFINYIVAKDKARQNIQISSKLIELQDASRKATQELLNTPSDEKNSNEFLKVLHKVKGEESTISTSQKLLADLLQEFAHVVEAMTNSTKGLLDAWGRVMRTVTRP